MPGLSKNSSKKKAVERPFEASVLEKARATAGEYRYLVDREDDVYFGNTMEMPYVMADGPTMEEAITATREATITAIATLLEKGETPPVPASQNRRTEQVNIRLTPEERFQIDAAARREGFRGVSDFMRAQASRAATNTSGV